MPFRGIPAESDQFSPARFPIGDPGANRSLIFIALIFHKTALRSHDQKPGRTVFFGYRAFIILTKYKR
jgi:hypothetical protein